MKDLFKGKFVTILVVAATVILAGVAIFTALRLYQLRQESISLTRPESEPSAWDCKNYTFNVDGKGVVTVSNNSTRDEAFQQAQVYINDQLKATFDVPALPKGQKATLGTVDVPQDSFSWRVVGTKDCSNSGKSTPAPIACQLMKFSLTQPSPTITPTTTVVPTNTLTPVPSATLTPIPTSTPTNIPTPTQPPIGGVSPTPTTVAQATPTPTTAFIAAASPTPGGAALPDAGIATPTLIIGFAGMLLILFAFLLAF